LAGFRFIRQTREPEPTFENMIMECTVAKKKFYVVWVGKQIGVFTDWSVVQPLVTGYPGAKHKSYPSMEEAKGAFDLGGTAAKSASTKPRTKKRVKKFVLDKAYDIHIFSDGACDPNPGEAGSGVAIYEGGGSQSYGTDAMSS